jgi:hypothetical protein
MLGLKGRGPAPPADDQIPISDRSLGDYDYGKSAVTEVAHGRYDLLLTEIERLKARIATLEGETSG